MRFTHPPDEEEPVIRLFAPSLQLGEILRGLRVRARDHEESRVPAEPEVMLLLDSRDIALLALRLEVIMQLSMVFFARDKPQLLFADEDHRSLEALGHRRVVPEALDGKIQGTEAEVVAL